MSTSREKYFNGNRGKDLRRTERTKTWNVSDMWDRHHEIARMLMLGMNNREIAKRIGCTPQTVSNVRNSPVVQDQLTIMKAARDADTVELAREIEEVAPDCVRLLTDIIRGEGDGANASISLRAKEANGMLARVGHGIPQRVQSESVSVKLTSDDIKDIKRRAMAGNDVIDVTCKEVVNE